MFNTQTNTDMQNHNSKMGTSGVLLIGLLSLGFSISAVAAETGEGLKLPEDLAGKAEKGPAPKYTVEERRIQGRLDRITVRREGGIDETYENTEVDSLWQTEDDELGETQNLRRWTIGSW